MADAQNVHSITPLLKAKDNNVDWRPGPLVLSARGAGGGERRELLGVLNKHK